VHWIEEQLQQKIPSPILPPSNAQKAQDKPGMTDGSLRIWIFDLTDAKNHLKHV
jgi:hypothetical protein